MSGNGVYLGNPNLKKANVQQNWTKKEITEYTKCMKDPIYFIQHFVRIVNIDEGLVPFNNRFLFPLFFKLLTKRLGVSQSLGHF